MPNAPNATIITTTTIKPNRFGPQSHVNNNYGGPGSDSAALNAATLVATATATATATARVVAIQERQEAAMNASQNMHQYHHQQQVPSITFNLFTKLPEV